MTTSTGRIGVSRIAAFCVAACVLAAFGIWQCAVAAGGDAHDFHLYEAGVAAMRAGEDPYAAGVIERHGAAIDLSFVYPPLATLALAPLTDLGVAGAMAAYAACLLLACALLHRTFAPRGAPWLCGLLAFAATGFALARWNFQTGNLGLAELLGFALAAVALHRGRFLAFAVLIGALALFKLLPICFGLLLLPAIRRQQVPWHAALWPAVVLLLLLGISFAIEPSLTASWWDMLAGGVAGKHTPLHEQTSGNNNPTFVLLLADLIALEPGIGSGDAAALLLAAIGLGTLARALLGVMRREDSRDVVPLLTVALLLCWPRLKPYGYGYAFVAVVVWAGRATPRQALLLLALLGAVPAVMPWMPNLPIDALQLMKRNHLAVLLLLTGTLMACTPRAARSGSDAPSGTGSF
jgi:hypothetical protein